MNTDDETNNEQEGSSSFNINKWQNYGEGGGIIADYLTCLR